MPEEKTENDKNTTTKDPEQLAPEAKKTEGDNKTQEKTDNKVEDAAAIELKKQHDELQAKIKAMEVEQASEKKKLEEEKLTKEQLEAKREAELAELKRQNLINSVRQDEGFTHKIFKFATISAADEKTGLTEKDVKDGLVGFKAILDEYYEKHVKPIKTPGGVTGGDKDKKSTEGVKPQQTAAIKFGFLPAEKTTA